MESWIVDELVQQGVEHFCIAPGSRSTPLVLAALKLGVKTHVHFDERGLAFFALGLAMSTKKPTAIIVTSGTALGNLMPAVMEAYHSFCPLLLLSADRPFFLRDSGANQTTDQVKFFGSFVKKSIDLFPEAGETAIRSSLANACFCAQGIEPGPVQINCPFVEPFDQPLKKTTHSSIQMHLPKLSAPKRVFDTAKGLLVVGKLPSEKDLLALLDLGKRLRWPIRADLLSNARLYPSRELLRYPEFNSHPTPELVLHFGERLTSKTNALGGKWIHISPYARLQDPERRLQERIQADIASFAEQMEAPSDPSWIASWKDLAPTFPKQEILTEVHMMQELSLRIREEFAIFLGNGMPIRDADRFLFPKACRGFYANRGLSGIDGNIATIAALAEKSPTLGIIGDQAALYDLNSLPLLNKTKHPVFLLISNNFGGGIFHHLPIRHSPHFEHFWAGKHELNFERMAKAFDLPYYSFKSLEEAFENQRSCVIEFQSNREQNYLYQCSINKS